jgi:Zn-dependent alcohol dehydrogenase
VSCGECELCERGEQTLCSRDRKLGGDSPVDLRSTWRCLPRTSNPYPITST